MQHSPARVRPRLYYGWILIVTLAVTTVVTYGGMYYSFGVLLKPLVDEFGWSRAAVSGAFSGTLIVSGLLGIPIGRLVDRFGARWLMSVGSILAGAALIALGFVTEIWQFYALWGLAIGLASALTFYNVSFTVLSNWFSRRRGTALGVLTLIGGLASPIFIPLIGWLVPAVGWRQTVIILGILQIVITLPLHAWLVRRHPEDLGLHPDGDPAPDPTAAQAASALAESWTIRDAVRSPNFWILTGAFFLEQLAAMVVLVHMVPFMIDKGAGRGFTPELAAAIGGLVGVASLPGRFVLSHLSDRIHRQGMLAGVLILEAVGLVILIAAGEPLLLYAFAIVYGLPYGARSPLRAAVMGDFFGRAAFGTIWGLQSAATAVAAGFGPAIAGSLYDQLNSYQVAFTLTAATLVLAALTLLIPRRPKRLAG
ncbi:MAG TPA: MFS transporter [Dehalococcoidia bacterium]|nr:MFS transporter [Dehalococcoidia bacterium]